MGGRLKTVTPSLTLLGIVSWTYCSEGGERSVHSDGLVDQDTTERIERREEQTGGSAGRRDSLGDLKEDIEVFRTPRLSPEIASPQAKHWPLP